MLKTKSIALILGVVTMSFLASCLVLAAWTEPTVGPPNGNVDAPINVGPIEQWKDGRLGVGSSSQGIYWLTDNGDSLYFQNKGGETKMVIGDNGNVGIGTIAPDSKLEIAQGVSGFAEVLKLTNLNGAQSDSVGLAFENTYTGVPLAKIRGYVGVVGNNGGGLDLMTRNGSTGSYTTVLTVRDNSDGTGNVGIGTTGPDSKLDINGPLEVGTSDRGVMLTSSATDNFQLKTWDDNPNPNFYIGMGDGAGGWSRRWIGAEGTGGNLFLVPDGGNVGIGTTGPSEELVVLRNQAGANTVLQVANLADDSSADAVVSLETHATGGNPFVHFLAQGDIDYSIGMHNTGDYLALSRNGSFDGNYDLVLDDTGNIGIGIRDPVEKLEIVGPDEDNWGTYGNLLIGFQGASGKYGGIGISSDGFGIQSHVAKPLLLNPAGNNVGIGTTNPQAKLDVQGGGMIAGNPTGGDMGAGTINAEEVYVNGVAIGGGGSGQCAIIACSNTGVNYESPSCTATCPLGKTITSACTSNISTGGIVGGPGEVLWNCVDSVSHI